MTDWQRSSRATYAATFAAKYLGHADLATLAAQQCRTAASTLVDEPEWLGMAEFATVHTLPPEARSRPLQWAGQAIDHLDSAAGHPRAGQVYGMLTSGSRSAMTTSTSPT